MQPPDIAPRDRLIVALDLPDVAAAEAMIARLGDSVAFYKIGYQLGYAGGLPLVRKLADAGKKVFVDLKLHDIGNTVARGVESVAKLGATFLTVHAYPQTMKAAVEARAGSGLKILAVTVLTSLDSDDLREMGVPDVDVRQLVLSRARRMLQAGCDGVISSGLEVSGLRHEYGDNFLIVVPGIRPVENRREGRDDQKRVVDVETAFRDGADYVVVGRPIRSAMDRPGAAADFQARIARVFGQSS